MSGPVERDRQAAAKTEVVAQPVREGSGRQAPPSPALPIEGSSQRREGREIHRGSLLVANFASAFESLWANRLRSLLTTLGVVIGVAAVIAAMTLTQGASVLIQARLSVLGTNTLLIVPGAATSSGAFSSLGSQQSLTQGDADALASIPHVVQVSPVLSLGAQVIYGSQNWNTRIQGVYPGYRQIQGWEIAGGRWLNAHDELTGLPVAVLGQVVANSLFGPSGTNPVGQTIRIGTQTFRVVGVLQPKGSFGAFSQDDVVFVPFTAALIRLKNSSYVDQIQVLVDKPEHVNTVQRAVDATLLKRHRISAGSPADFQIRNANQLLQTAQQATQTLTLLLVGIAGISLTVGGIGIMNIMLVSVTERTREIGIRMAVGARRRDIRNQFLIEALTLSSLGGILGIVLGLLAGWLMTTNFGVPFVPQPLSILLAFGVSALVGVTFGFYPAVRAARLDPIIALRTE
ncbi:ABC transporter permease [Thermogemmatispora carboxidivorans]|uniref:ABC transporter permease n=1 Tax=Thermogemmatispora carboxidivorans TaxID=1382306 RepID=UPI00069C24EE|nr:ABC transporter permease [Thermogemmatispora carboxidivorans]